MRNLVVPPNFVSINGKDFGEVVASKMVNYGKDGKELTLQMPKIHTTILTKPRLKFAEAKKELQAKRSQFPIHLDKTVDLTNKAEIKESIHETIN